MNNVIYRNQVIDLSHKDDSFYKFFDIALGTIFRVGDDIFIKCKYNGGQSIVSGNFFDFEQYDKIEVYTGDIILNDEKFEKYKKGSVM